MSTATLPSTGTATTATTVDGWQQPVDLPDSAVLHNVAFDLNRDGMVERVYCRWCGADVEDYDVTEAIDAGADPCDGYWLR